MIPRLTIVMMLLIAGAASAQVLVVSGGADTLLDRPVSDAQLSDIPARDALAWLADAAGLGLIVNWDRLAEHGYDPERRVSISLRGVSLRIVLKLVLSDIFDSQDIVVEITPEYIRVLTREQADNAPVIKVYTIGDILHEVPNFAGPELDIGSASAGGGGGSGFQAGEVANDQSAEGGLTRDQRGQQLADQIRNSIEPDIWEENGGTMGRITYYEGRLIIRAPEYVHQQIGMSDRPAPEPAVETTPTVPPADSMTSSYSTSIPAPVAYVPSHAQTTQPYRPWTYPTARSDFSTVPVSGIDWTQAK